MEPMVLDTDVLSYLAKSATRAALYHSALAGKLLCISFQTVAELRLWAIMRNWGSARQEAVESLFDRVVVLHYDAPMAQHWAEVTTHRRRSGRPINCGDAWIAASALRHGAPLVSHNAKDFTEIPDLRLISHGN